MDDDVTFKIINVGDNRLEMAHNLLKLGVKIYYIVQASGLSEEEIREN